VKLLHLVGFITKKIVTMHGHVNVKKKCMKDFISSETHWRRSSHHAYGSRRTTLYNGRRELAISPQFQPKIHVTHDRMSAS